jgi:NAD-dependent deacetylase
LVTQNVDGLHREAGSERVIELHGSLFQTRCATCDRPPFADRDVYASDRLPVCGRCQATGALSPLRPHIVWFGERLDPAHLTRIEAFLRAGAGRRVFLAAGTSGSVSPAAELVQAARSLGAETWLVNAEAPRNVGDFEQVHLGSCGALLPAWVA